MFNSQEIKNEIGTGNLTSTEAAMNAWETTKRPANVLIDGDDVPDHKVIEGQVEAIFDAYAGMVENTIMGEMDHLEPLLWGMVNIFYRQIGQYETRIDRKEVEVRDLLPAAGQEVTDVQIQQLNDEITALRAIRDTYEKAQEEATRQYDRYTGSVWRPRNGVARSVSYDRNVTAATYDFKAAKQAERNKRDERNSIDAGLPTFGIAPGSKYEDYERIYKSLSYVYRQSGEKMNIVFAGYTKNAGCDRIVTTFANNNPGVNLIPFGLEQKDGSARGYIRNNRIVNALVEMNGRLLAFGSKDDVNSMFTDCIKKANDANIPVVHMDPTKK